MSGYRFSAAERFAIYTVHGATCYLGGEPLDLSTMCVDHILPRSLSSEPDRLALHVRDFGLPESFLLDSFENWLPACSRCNGLKSSRPFRPTPIIQIYIDRASSRAAEVRAHVGRTLNNAEISKALTIIQKGLDTRQIDPASLALLIGGYDEGRPKYENAKDELVELRLSPSFKVLYDARSYQVVSTQFGAGYVPTEETVDSSFYCGNCGSLGPWSGARCLSCGHLVGDD